MGNSLGINDLTTFGTSIYAFGPPYQGGGGVGKKTTKNHVGGRGGQAENHVDISQRFFYKFAFFVRKFKLTQNKNWKKL